MGLRKQAIAACERLVFATFIKLTYLSLMVNRLTSYLLVVLPVIC